MEPLAVQRSDRRWTVRFRPADEFGAVQYPEWAQAIASEHSAGARVRCGRVASDGQLVEVVAVNRSQHGTRDEAVAVAETIAETVEA